MKELLMLPVICIVAVICIALFFIVTLEEAITKPEERIKDFEW